MYKQVEEQVDRDFRMKEGNMNWVRGFVTAQLPWKWKDDTIAKLGVRFEKAGRSNWGQREESKDSD